MSKLTEKEFEKIDYVRTSTELGEFVAEKDTMYGHAFFNMVNEYGIDYALSKMEEKLFRLKQLKKLGKMNHSESFKDSVKDLQGYALLTLLYIQACEEAEEKKKTQVNYTK